MKKKNLSGRRLFAPDDWVTVQQVRGVFASLQLKLQKQNPERPGLELNLKKQIADDLKEVLTELDAIETLNIVDSVTEQISQGLCVHYVYKDYVYYCCSKAKHVEIPQPSSCTGISDNSLLDTI